MSVTPQPDLRPLCPVHHKVMAVVIREGTEALFACAESGCNLHWIWTSGYYCIQDGRMTYPANVHQILRPAPIREHGYLYIAEIDAASGQRTWRCAIKDCSSVIIDDLHGQ